MMNRRFFLLLLGAGSGLTFLTGCVGHHTSRRTSRLLDDKVTTDRVQAALARASSSAFAKVNVATVDSVVTLSGSVSTPKAKSKAEQLAQSVQQVRKVDNQLQVR